MPMYVDTGTYKILEQEQVERKIGKKQVSFSCHCIWKGQRGARGKYLINYTYIPPTLYQSPPPPQPPPLRETSMLCREYSFSFTIFFDCKIRAILLHNTTKLLRINDASSGHKINYPFSSNSQIISLEYQKIF
jgi:hypothetical protein